MDDVSPTASFGIRTYSFSGDETDEPEILQTVSEEVDFTPDTNIPLFPTPPGTPLSGGSVHSVHSVPSVHSVHSLSSSASTAANMSKVTIGGEEIAYDPSAVGSDVKAVILFAKAKRANLGEEKRNLQKRNLQSSIWYL